MLLTGAGFLFPKQSGTKPKVVAKILATDGGDLLCKGYPTGSQH